MVLRNSIKRRKCETQARASKSINWRTNRRDQDLYSYDVYLVWYCIPKYMHVPVRVYTCLSNINIVYSSSSRSVPEDSTPKILHRIRQREPCQYQYQQYAPVYTRDLCGEMSDCVCQTRKMPYNDIPPNLLYVYGEQHAVAYRWRCISMNVMCEKNDELVLVLLYNTRISIIFLCVLQVSNDEILSCQ